MDAVTYRSFGGPLALEQVPDPSPARDGVVIRVRATGLCRSDWHGWMGHDPDVRLPQVPGHEFAGVVEAVGDDVTSWRPGDRVTVPFVCACGTCAQCRSGNHQVCERQVQPGFGQWGSFADFVAVDRADVNLVALPDDLDFVTAASLGCRFATSFRAVVDRGRVAPGEWVAVHGCGGVGLSAVMIAAAHGARVVAVDVDPAALALARRVGADAVVDASSVTHVADRVRELTGGGSHLSLDAFGSAVTCRDAVAGLRTRGRHVQVGLLVGEDRAPAVPMERVVAEELELLGSHGMQAHRYDELLGMVADGRLRPNLLVGRTIGLAQVVEELPRMDRPGTAGMTVVDRS